jgi:UPF0042 nucleotide-binding protein
VVNYLSAQPAVGALVQELTAFLEGRIREFARASRSYLTVAIGCTGGEHRSVYFAEALARRFGAARCIMVRHRELS